MQGSHDLAACEQEQDMQTASGPTYYIKMWLGRHAFIYF